MADLAAGAGVDRVEVDPAVVARAEEGRAAVDLGVADRAVVAQADNEAAQVAVAVAARVAVAEVSWEMSLPWMEHLSPVQIGARGLPQIKAPTRDRAGRPIGAGAPAAGAGAAVDRAGRWA